MFHVFQVTFLGYVISVEGVAMDKEKVSIVTTWPQLTTVKELEILRLH